MNMAEVQERDQMRGERKLMECDDAVTRADSSSLDGDQRMDQHLSWPGSCGRSPHRIERGNPDSSRARGWTRASSAMNIRGRAAISATLPTRRRTSPFCHLVSIRVSLGHSLLPARATLLAGKEEGERKKRKEWTSPRRRSVGECRRSIGHRRLSSPQPERPCFRRRRKRGQRGGKKDGLSGGKERERERERESESRAHPRRMVALADHQLDTGQQDLGECHERKRGSGGGRRIQREIERERERERESERRRAVVERAAPSTAKNCRRRFRLDHPTQNLRGITRSCSVHFYRMTIVSLSGDVVTRVVRILR